jgi:hypothetical protein
MHKKRSIYAAFSPILQSLHFRGAFSAADNHSPNALFMGKSAKTAVVIMLNGI